MTTVAAFVAAFAADPHTLFRGSRCRNGVSKTGATRILIFVSRNGNIDYKNITTNCPQIVVKKGWQKSKSKPST
ncbi:hypothetical protein GQ42DRAFT_161398 [Ramicandelaber brevisporus]|nr:hypothetical protein GQ42DRAFT_161398 [Ramicandelaber brevisporus]